MTDAAKTISELRQVKDQASATIEADLAKLRDDIASLASSVRALAADAASSAVANAKTRLSSAADEAKAAAERGRDTVQTTVESHPFYTILAAVGVGFLLGQWMRRE